MTRDLGFTNDDNNRGFLDSAPRCPGTFRTIHIRITRRGDGLEFHVWGPSFPENTSDLNVGYLDVDEATVRTWVEDLYREWTDVINWPVDGPSELPADARPGTVTIYGRNAPEEDGWFGLVTADDPPQVVGFGADGVGCLDGPPGTAIAWFDGAPGEGGQPKQLIGRIPADGSPVVLSVEVTPDGRLLVGHGVPVWWEGDPQVC